MSTAPTPGPAESATSAETARQPAPERPAPPGPASAKRGRPRPSIVFDDPLDGRSSDDTDDGWGERPATGDSAAADLARFLDEKPPHHL
ncbi:hypothetical protein OG875_18180 [Streptomyces sp. NBC_01498]|uniref:hypothetical protein n=1 Tax=Streptomyces sp. NBC_01498 TaxID=2975870 RepID=UPI002E7AD51A|nr:hypothetical protein [Streptomyces sp. NBC_01498]WTL26344.1 hypothetical protein OG875_18180 [Streptomyces sp. NBC_01498]